MTSDKRGLEEQLEKLLDRIETLLDQNDPSSFLYEINGAVRDPTTSLKQGNLERWRFADIKVRQAELRRGELGAPLSEGGCWNIVMYMLRSQLEGRGVSVTDAAAASLRSPTTGLRCVEMLIKTNAIQRTPDLNDKRRTWLVLTSETLNAIERYQQLEREELEKAAQTMPTLAS